MAVLMKHHFWMLSMCRPWSFKRTITSILMEAHSLMIKKYWGHKTNFQTLQLNFAFVQMFLNAAGECVDVDRELKRTVQHSTILSKVSPGHFSADVLSSEYSQQRKTCTLFHLNSSPVLNKTVSTLGLEAESCWEFETLVWNWNYPPDLLSIWSSRPTNTNTFPS